MATIKHNAQRVAVLIDTANLYHSAKNIYKARVNFGAVLKEAVGARQLVRAIAYVITTEGGEEKAFFDALTKVGIETRTKDLQVFNDGAKKADWDVGITVDAIALASKLDTIILVTGDGDFVPLVEYIQNAWGCQVEVVAFGRATSAALKAATDSFTDLCDEPRNFLIGYRGTPSRGGTRKTTSKKSDTSDVDHSSHTLAAEEVG